VPRAAAFAENWRIANSRKDWKSQAKIDQLLQR